MTDARELFRRYLEQQADLGQPPLVLDGPLRATPPQPVQPRSPDDADAPPPPDDISDKTLGMLQPGVRNRAEIGVIGIEKLSGFDKIFRLNKPALGAD